MDNHRVVLSDDGSPTLLSLLYGETYHSTYGALEESLTVFISAGFHRCRLDGLKKINILEMGFGTGLNAFLSLVESNQYNLEINYTGVEAHPISPIIVQVLNYPKVISKPEYSNAFDKMHTCIPEKNIALSENFTFIKRIGRIEEISISSKYHLIYYDAFAPLVQEELWTEQIMKKMYDALLPNGILVTYCAKGSFKRALKAVGFQIEALPGPKGKRQMTRAIK